VVQSINIFPEYDDDDDDDDDVDDGILWFVVCGLRFAVCGCVFYNVLIVKMTIVFVFASLSSLVLLLLLLLSDL
jgi:hypothetical protein